MLTTGMITSAGIACVVTEACVGSAQFGDRILAGGMPLYLTYVGTTLVGRDRRRFAFAAALTA